MNQAVISGLYVYPIKSCRGIALTQVEVRATGLAQDRRWMLVNAQGKFVTQREQGRLALVTPVLQGAGVQVSAPGMPALTIAGTSQNQPVIVMIWGDSCPAFDEGDVAAEWFSQFLGVTVRLVRFDDTHARRSSRDWTGEVEAFNQFSDGFPLLAISNASLADLNTRLPTPLPMNRFRPNLVLDDLPAYGEDQVYELRSEALCLRVVKPCTRCKITTTDQDTGLAQGFEPLSTLRAYRRSIALKGVTFGQNVMVVDGAGALLTVGQRLSVSWRQE